MQQTTKRPVTAEEYEAIIDNGGEVSQFFSDGRMVRPGQRVNVDFAPTMLTELDTAARELNISRQAVIKTLVRQGLDQHYLAVSAQRAAKAA